ncbi:MAG: hypothetical protein AB7E12_11915 [Burkholderiaceae bacterium]
MTLKHDSTLAGLIAGLIIAGSAVAAPPPGKGNGNGGPPPHAQSGPGNSGGANAAGNAYRGPDAYVNIRFSDSQRSYLNNYFGRQFRMGNCPPGLAKKNNGCMPPGQAKKWRIGYPLGRDVIFYDLPSAVLAELGYPPAGYRYVRVANDILMLAVGTGLVVDAIANLGGN